MWLRDNVRIYRFGFKKEVQHVYLVEAKSLGAYGGYETFVY